ncbi:hypothetical protein J1N35_044045 [Gossypium stocksii]|uniref:Uncharacterized protein n=1 Tax=Gossypium stocksii TaxID=47602 RepID=A0A9D3U883_9ROSI|nr:hypothetical protein J1N35_044045 [Gossypium stocksii]
MFSVAVYLQIRGGLSLNGVSDGRVLGNSILFKQLRVGCILELGEIDTVRHIIGYCLQGLSPNGRQANDLLLWVDSGNVPPVEPT